MRGRIILKMRNRENKSKITRIFMTIAVAMLVLVSLASFEHIVREKDHHCTGSSCAICQSLEYIKQESETLNIAIITMFVFAVSFVLYKESVNIIEQFTFFISPVNIKTRLNL